MSNVCIADGTGISNFGAFRMGCVQEKEEFICIVSLYVYILVIYIYTYVYNQKGARHTYIAQLNLTSSQYDVM